MKIFSTKLNKIVDKVKKYLNIWNKPININYFKDGEIFISISENIKNENVILIQSLSKPVNNSIIETVFTLEALRNLTINNITLVITYLCYSRQDRLTMKGSIVSANIISKMISIKNINKIYLLDPHFNHIQSFFNKPTFYYTIISQICENITLKHDLKNLFIIALDKGSFNRAKKISDSLKVPILSINKIRINNKILMNINENIKFYINKTGIIIDDIIDTGNSIITTIKLLLDYKIKEILIYVTHGVLSNGNIKQLNLTISNSIYNENINLIDISYLISRLIKYNAIKKSDFNFLI